MSQNVQLVNIIEARNTQFGSFRFMTRPWHPKKSYVRDTTCTPEQIKEMVARSTFIDIMIDVLHTKLGIPKEQLQKQVKEYLEEMYMDKKMHVIRWMGILFLRISFMMKLNIFVNESAILEIKREMGNNPVLFLPTHRSYADFCVLTYLCYHYDIELPAVAAGMDFSSMAIMGERMRETGAFFIRRSMGSNALYGYTLKEYVRLLVTHYHAPVEFFIEGTRSRTNKLLNPKHGLLVMSLTPFFTGEVSDVTLVPINIGYDRIMEERLFAYEHIGVPKPKETTGGFLKALRNLNDNFGNIYVNFGTPISLKEYVKDNITTGERLRPLSMHGMTEEQLFQIRNVAAEVAKSQERCTIMSPSSVLALVLMDSLMHCKPLNYDELLMQMEWTKATMTGLGAPAFEEDVKSSVDRLLVVHRKLFGLDKENSLRLLIGDAIEVSDDVIAKRGNIVKAETIAMAVPVIQLQLYINPIVHYIYTPALVYLLVRRGSTAISQVENDLHLLKTYMVFEFLYVARTERHLARKGIDICLQNRVLFYNNDTLSVGDAYRLQFLFEMALLPFLSTTVLCLDILIEKGRFESAALLRSMQERAQQLALHPYCLSTESGLNCLRSLHATEIINKHTNGKHVEYEVTEKTERCRELFRSVLPPPRAVWDGNNPVFERRPSAPSHL